MEILKVHIKGPYMLGAIEDNGEVNIIAVKSTDTSTFKIIDPMGRATRKLCNNMCASIQKKIWKRCIYKI